LVPKVKSRFYSPSTVTSINIRTGWFMTNWSLSLVTQTIFTSIDKHAWIGLPVHLSVIH